MKKIYFNLNDNIEEIIKQINSITGNNLVLSFIQENRKLEEIYGLSNEVIYDNQDYMTGIMSFGDISIEVNDNLDIIPSSYKIKKNTMDFNQVLKDIDKLNYDNVFIIFDDKLEIENKPEIKVEDKKVEKKSFLKKLKGLFIYEEL